MVPKQFNLWLPAYIKDRAARVIDTQRPRHVWVTIADHYEPCGGNASFATAQKRVGKWLDRWPGIADDAPKDSAGQSPCYTFFYPQEEYQREILNLIAELTHSACADVEVHLHHDHDNASSFRNKIHAFCRCLHEQHGLLRYDEGRLAFGFIHGNWALDNSRPDGRWCGVSGELQILRELGCYADFTMPSLPSPTQSRTINSIYHATGDSKYPRGFDTGIAVTPGGGSGAGLLLIPGPLGLRYRDRIMPRIETGELAVYDLPTPYRVKRWFDLAPHVGNHIFIKLYAHGAREDNAQALLGEGNTPGILPSMFHWIQQEALKRNLLLHWTSAYAMYSAIHNLAHSKDTMQKPVRESAGEVSTA